MTTTNEKQHLFYHLSFALIVHLMSTTSVAAAAAAPSSNSSHEQYMDSVLKQAGVYLSQLSLNPAR